MKYPVNITLRKINSLEDAKYPQREKYPDGTERMGLMWEHTKPKVGECFYVMNSKLYSNFRTSRVAEILEETEKEITFKTLNSSYKIVIQ